MFHFIRRLCSSQVHTLNNIHIYSKNIVHNYNYLQSLQPHAAIFPVLKSNAYGHGLLQILQIIKHLDVPYIVVDSYPEYQQVYKNSRHNILLLGETITHNYKHFDRRRTTFVVYNIDTLHALGRRSKETKIHLFINTGMYREGLDPYEIDSFLDELMKYPHIELEGVLSHLHSADEFGIQSIKEQIALFKKTYHYILDAGLTPKYRYIGNSAGLLKIQDDFFNAYRPGLALYGYSPLDHEDEYYNKAKKLKPALSLTSTVVAVQQLASGQGVSYNYQRKAQQATSIAVVPFGYAEGLPRISSGHIRAKCKRKYVQQVGTITMNLSTFDMQDHHINVGDTIELISNNPSDRNSILALAQASQTIVYETLVRLDPKIRRNVV